MGDVLLDSGSPYEHARKEPHGDYWRVRLPAHPTAGKNGLAGLHRVVLHDAIGPGPHPCALCELDGLDWGLGTNHHDNLIVDHINHNRSDDRRSNLRPVHKWCNDNRDLIERHGIPWEHFKDQPISERIAIRIAGGPHKGSLTPAAEKLIAQLAEQPLTPIAEEPLDESPKVRDNLTTWAQLRSRQVPEPLAEKYPFLKGIE